MNRTHRTLAGLLLVQVVLILLFRSPLSSSTSGSEPRPLLPGLEDVDVSRIELSSSDGETLNLERSGEAWTVAEAEQFPADADKIRDLLDELASIEVRRPVVASDRYHAAFEVTDDENEGRLRIWAGDDAPEAELILGSSANYMMHHVRVQGDDRVYEVRGLAPYDVRPNSGDWIEKSLVDVGNERVVGLRVTNPGGSFALKREDGGWTLAAPEELAGSPLDDDKVANLVRLARTLRLDAAVGRLDAAAQGLDEPAATIVLEIAPEEGEGAPEEVAVRIGSRLPDKDTQRYVTRSGMEFAATIWESSVKDLIEQAAADLVATEDPEAMLEADS